MIKNWLVALGLCVSILLPSFSFAQSNENFDPTAAGAVSSFMMKVQQDFNREMTATMVADLIDNPAVGWNSGGLVRTIFIVCFIIALAQALSSPSPNAMVTEMAKLAFWSWLVIALLGGPTYQKFSFLSTGDSSYTSSVNSLDVDIFNFAAYHMDSAADSMFSAAGPDKMIQSVMQNKIITENLINARQYCPPGPSAENASCLQQFMKETLVDPETVRPGSTKEKEESGYSLLPPSILKFFSKIILLSADLSLVSFYLFSWAVDILRSMMNMFILISFGIITGFSFFIMKFMFPFAVIPKYRPMVMKAMKVPLSATMFGFATSLIVYISAVGYAAMNTASIKVIFKAIASGNSGALVMALSSIQTSVTAGMLIFALIQIFAIVKVPKFCRDLLNLSFDSVVNFAAEVVETGVKVVGMAAAAVATGGAALAAGGAGGVLGRLSGSIGGGLSAVGQRFGLGGGAAGAPTSLFRGGPGGAGGPGGLGSTLGNVAKAPSQSIAGMQVGSAEDSARSSVGTTASVARAVTQESVLPTDRIIKDPDKRAGRSGLAKAASAGLGLASKAKSRLAGGGGESGGVFSNLVGAGLEAGLGRTVAFDRLVNDKVSGIGESAVQGINDTTERFLDPVSYQAKQEKIKEARIAAGLPEEDNFILGANSTVARALKASTGYKAFQSNNTAASQASHAIVSGAIDKVQSAYENTALKPGSARARSVQESLMAAKQQALGAEQQQQLQQVNAAISSGTPVTPQMVSQMSSLSNNYDLPAEDRQKVNDILAKENQLSMDRIAENKANEEDYKMAFRSQNAPYASRESKARFDKLTESNEEFGSYVNAQRDTNERLASQVKNTSISSSKGSELLTQLSSRVNDGMYERSSFRGDVVRQVAEFNKEIKQKVDAENKRKTEKVLNDYYNLEKKREKVITQDALKIQHEESEYQFGQRSGKISTDVFAKDGSAYDDFGEIDQGLIDKLTEQSTQMRAQINQINSGSPEYRSAASKRLDQLSQDVLLLDQIINAYNNSKNKK